MYTPLYVKTNYSFLSSLIKIDDLIERCIKLNMKSVAICDDNMIATMYFYKKCINSGIKPIIGVEIKYSDKPILLYAKNYSGYQNILKLLTKDISKDILTKYSEDVLCIIPYQSINIFNDIKSCYYDIYLGFSNKNEEYKCLELTNNVVFLNKILYLDKKDSKYFKYAIMLKEKKNVLDDITYLDNNNYILPQEIITTLTDKKGIDATNVIANMCNLEFPKTNNLIPVYENSLGVDSAEYLTKLSIQGITLRLGGEVPEIYKKRLLYELDTIKKMGFSDYFLIVYDYVKFAKKSGILVGPGRGSAGGSLVAYALGIMDVDPIKYNLLFERFLNPGRDTMPDIDIDFPDESRSLVIDYVRKKYGNKKVAGIVAISTMQAKAALDDVSKILKISQEKTDRLKKFVDKNLKYTYENNYEFKNIIDNDDRLSLLYDVSCFFEGFPKNTTVHASGVIISKEDLDNVIPLIKKEDMYISSFEMGYLEELGLLKMDFLGNSHLTTIMNILENIKKYENINIDFFNIPLDDKKTLELFYNINTNGIFHFDSEPMKNLLQKLKITCFDDIVAAEALVRPGPDTETYLKRKNNNLKVEYPSKSVEEILSPTYGVLVYQEQIMQIANKMAGFSLQEADILRWAMSKKKKNILASQEEKFVSGAIKNGYSYEISKKIYDDILSFAEYGFNKSHSVAYSMIAYKMGYLKMHYSKYFYLSSLSSVIGNGSLQIIREAKNVGVDFLLPNINKSTNKYQVVGNSILFPISSIKNIDNKRVGEFVKLREKPFDNIFECLTRLIEIGFNRKHIESMIYASCFDDFGYNKNTLISNLDNLLTYAFIAKGIDSDIIEHPSIEIKEEFSKELLVAKEKELFGFYLSNHPTNIYVDRYKVTKLSDIANYYNKTIDTLIYVERIKTHKDKNGNTMAFILGSDELTSCEYIVFSKIFKDISETQKGNILLLRGKVEKKENYQIIVEKAKIVA